MTKKRQNERKRRLQRAKKARLDAKQNIKSLPSKGKTSANSRKAKGQRRITATRQAVNQQRIFVRGLQQFIRRQKAEDKQSAAAKGTKGTSTRTGRDAAGKLKKTGSTSLQRGKKGGKLSLTNRSRVSSSPTSLRIQKVKVRVEGQKQRPPGKKGGALSTTNRIRRRNINRNNASSTIRQGTSNAPNRVQPRLTSRATAVPARMAVKNFAGGISKVSGAIGLLLTAGLITKDLADSFRRGEGLARIPGLLKRLSDKNKADIKARSGRSGQGGRRSSPGNRNRNQTAPKSGSKRSDTKSETSAKTIKPRSKRVEKPAPSNNKRPTPFTSNRSSNSIQQSVKPRPPSKPTRRTGANDPRNAAYIAARSKLNANSTKAERDKVRDLGMKIHNKIYGKKKKRNRRALAIGGYA